MNETELQKCTEELVATVLREMRLSLNWSPEHPSLLGELSSRLRRVIQRELQSCSDGSTSPAGLAEELALTTYFTIATEATETELSPEALLRLSTSLSETLEATAPTRRNDSTRTTPEEVWK